MFFYSFISSFGPIGQHLADKIHRIQYHNGHISAEVSIYGYLQKFFGSLGTLKIGTLIYGLVK